MYVCMHIQHYGIRLVRHINLLTPKFLENSKQRRDSEALSRNTADPTEIGSQIGSCVRRHKLKKQNPIFPPLYFLT
jgi:hypothetical protein